jgi:hypothetical protein
MFISTPSLLPPPTNGERPLLVKDSYLTGVRFANDDVSTVGFALRDLYLRVFGALGLGLGFVLVWLLLVLPVVHFVVLLHSDRKVLVALALRRLVGLVFELLWSLFSSFDRVLLDEFSDETDFNLVPAVVAVSPVVVPVVLARFESRLCLHLPGLPDYVDG